MDSDSNSCKLEQVTDSKVISPEAAPIEQVTAVDNLIDIDHFAKVELRVAKIISAESLPKSKKLIKLQVDLGSMGQRQVLAGIAQHYTPETLVGRKIVVVANLKPAKLMGIESQGMLLAASSPDNTQLMLVNPGEEMPEGSLVR